MEMLSVTPKESSPKGFVLPSPQFDKLVPKKSLGRVLPHFLSAQGMLLPRKDQPPPMYGPRGATVPAKFLTSYLPKKESKQQTLKTTESEYQKPGLTINRAIQKPPKQEESSSRPMCQPCQMRFQNEEELTEHCSQHERCEINDCTFLGHPSIMDNHIVKQHSRNITGIYEKYKKLNTPEDIAQWREERKKKFPTASNIELRKKIKEMRLKRGERLEGNKSRFAKRVDRKPKFKKFRRASKQTQPEVKNNEKSKHEDTEFSQKTKIPEVKGNHVEDDSKSKEFVQQSKSLGINEMHVESKSDPNELAEKTEKCEEERNQTGPDFKANKLSQKTKKSEVKMGLELKRENISQKTEKFEMKVDHEKRKSDSKDLPQKTKKRKRKCAPRKDSDNFRLLRDLAFSDDSADDDTRPIVMIPLDTFTDDEESSTLEIPMFRGTSTLPDYLRQEVKTKIIENPLSSLLGMYGSDTSDSETDNNDESKLKNKIEISLQNSIENNTETPKMINATETQDTSINDDSLCSLRKCHKELLPSESGDCKESKTADNASDDDEPPEEVAIEKSTSQPVRKQPNQPPRKIQNIEKPTEKNQQKPIRRSGLDYKKLRIQPPNTMLYKLLESDIRHERNVLLQCVRYVCENNFFGIGHSNTDNPST